MLLSMRNFLAMAPEGEDGSGDTGGNYSGGDFNMEEASARMAEEVFGIEQEDADVPEDDDDEELGSESNKDAEKDAEKDAKDELEAEKQSLSTRPVPASWSKEKHEVWSKMTPDAQEYVETREKQMRDGVQAIAKDAEYGRSLAQAIAPYKSLIQAQGLDDTGAVKHLLNAHHILTNAPLDQRTAYIYQLAGQYGIDIARPSQDGVQSHQRVDPVVRELQQQVRQMQGQLTQRQQADFESRSQQVASEVTSFANDEAHPYFDECSDEIVAQIHAGLPLQEAYDRAVWANPVTRAKEIARQTAENEAKFKARAKEQANAAKSTRKTNLNGRDTLRKPTATSGTIDDVMRATWAEMQSRDKH